MRVQTILKEQQGGVPFRHRPSCVYRSQQVHMGQRHGALGARVHEVVEPSHELLAHVVETERVARAALATDLEADGVLDVPVLFRVLRDLVPARGMGQTRGQGVDRDCTDKQRRGETTAVDSI